ncbi:transcription coactivator [Wolffia australiana]
MAGEPELESELFSGVHFVLFGFDSVSEAQYRSELVRRGGVDAGRYDETCTHVIACGRLHDDPICVAARNDGKVLVTELWIEDSVDFSELANPDRILYKPVRDLNGIPGSQSMVVCLTGYQRRERDDIMKMVDLMGAQFSKPLIASKVTHLVCYKFEGEKYELARRVNIKLVNHQWLEDCLRSWKILPEDSYNMSGWELEIMKAEAKNSDDESEECSRLRSARKRTATSENTNKQEATIKQEIVGPSETLDSKSLPGPSNERNSPIKDSVTRELINEGDRETKNIIKEDTYSELSPTSSRKGSSDIAKPSSGIVIEPVAQEDHDQRSDLKDGQRSIPQKKNGPVFSSRPIKTGLRKISGSSVRKVLPDATPDLIGKSPDSKKSDEQGRNPCLSGKSPVLLSSSASPSSSHQDSEHGNGTAKNLGHVSIEKSDVSVSDLPKSPPSNPSGGSLPIARGKRVVAKRKLSSLSKDSSVLSNTVTTEDLNDKPKISPQSVNQTSSTDDAQKENRSTKSQLKEDSSRFILSGHRLQRKEYQQVIKRLKGRLCRDSHNWSYDATHFIAPEPLRRTEKFFAAAASGRWILKSDYLAACGAAGKFLAEEEFEWAGSGLTGDGAISLEAPRKWRLLRERTGHGTLHGTRFVIYGECIAPSLDTLKRAVKAGDGEILATSPPYTRALEKGVDFAVISAGTPRGDPWVAEFIRREIPCVVADYLVELVCKPGYPLDRHVLFGTLTWAADSLARLLSGHQ